MYFKLLYMNNYKEFYYALINLAQDQGVTMDKSAAIHCQT